MNFLENIAHDLLKRFGTDMHNVTVVFPNKRASLFLNKYIAEQTNVPVWSPQYITISELFRSQSCLTVDNQIALICRLYDIFVNITGFKTETLDEFYGWGQLLLADFDDIDKNMASAKGVFSIVSDLHSYDTAEYINDRQRELLKSFFESFFDDHTSKMQEKFLRLWNNLYIIYEAYRESLRDDGLAYEGMLYREVVESLDSQISSLDSQYYVFAGFNHLHICEKILMDSLGEKAIFYWNDPDTNPDHNDDIDKDVRFLATPTESLQGRYVSQWLLENDRWRDGEKTAIVMCDESLLQTVISSIPDCVEKVNITTGYPLRQTRITAIVSELIDNPSTDIHEISDTVCQKAMDCNDPFESESMFQMYKILRQLIDLIDRDILHCERTTLRRLLMQIIDSTSIPFHGEPVEGIQIMGVLESRGLDFDHVLLLSCNEGNMPKGEGDASFIPHSIRKAYGLTTVENKVGIYEYYFSRLLQRCHDATITYNSSTEGLNTGEMSRFMLQMLVDRPGIRQKTLSPSQSCGQLTQRGAQFSDIEKTPDVMQRLYKALFERVLSPSALAMYLRCPAHFFYQHVAGLRQKDDDDTMDNRVFGLIFHDAAHIMMQELQDKNHIVTREALESLRKDHGHIERIVDRAYGKDILNGLELITRSVIIRLLRNLIDYDIEHAPIHILLLEENVSTEIPVTLADGSQRIIKVGGIIDRLDEADGVIRVIDYKTGTKAPGAIEFEDIFDATKDCSKSHADYFLQTMLYSYIVGDNATPLLYFVQEMKKKGYSSELKVKDTGDFLSSLQCLIREISNPEIPFFTKYVEKTCTAFCPFHELCKG